MCCGFFVATVFTGMLGCHHPDDRDLKLLMKVQTRIESNPSDSASLKKLQDYTHSGSFVIRANAIGVVGNIIATHPSLRSTLLGTLIEGLDDPDPAVQRAAAEQFAHLDPASFAMASDKLFAKLDSANYDVAVFLLEAIAKLGSDAKPVVPRLCNILSSPAPTGVQDEAPQLRIYAAEALRMIGAPTADEAIPHLKEALDDSNPYFQIAAAKALFALRPGNGGATEVLTRLRKSEDVAVSEAANEQ